MHKFAFSSDVCILQEKHFELGLNQVKAAAREAMADGVYLINFGVGRLILYFLNTICGIPAKAFYSQRLLNVVYSLSNIINRRQI